jgi:single-stranded-DNA-specific exonuclease
MCDTAPVGVLGLVASRLTERYYRPAVVVRRDAELARASLRSIPEVNIVAALEAISDLLVRFGGHAKAAGFTARTEELPAIRERLERVVHDALDGCDLRPEIAIDAEVALDEVTWGTYRALEELEPYGEGNPRPTLSLMDAPIAGVRCVGTNHLRFHVEGGAGVGAVSCIAFGQADRLAHLNGRLDLVGTMRADTWQGERRLELRVTDFRIVG